MSVVLNGNTYAITDFVGADGRGYSEIFAATGLQTFPESIFTDMLAELASATSIDAVSPGAAGGILVSDGSDWVRAASATITDAGALDLSNGTIAVTIGADAAASSRTDATDKFGRLGIAHYTNAEEPFSVFVAQSASAVNSLVIGGGTSVMNCATQIQFFTAANTTTTTGTQRLIINSTGATFAGILSVDDTTDATSTTNASIQTDGGQACVKNSIVGGAHLTTTVTTLADDGTPTVAAGNLFKTGGTTAITDFDDGVVGQTIRILAAHSVTITDGAPIILNGGGNFGMVATDTLTLTMFDDQVWQEVARSVN